MYKVQDKAVEDMSVAVGKNYTEIYFNRVGKIENIQLLPTF